MTQSASRKCERPMRQVNLQIQQHPAPLRGEMACRQQHTDHSPEHRSVEFTLQPGQFSKLNALAEEERISSTSVMIAGCLALLHNYCQQDDLVLGTRFEMTGTGDPCHLDEGADPVAIRTQIRKGMSARELVRQVHQVCSQARCREGLTFYIQLNASDIQLDDVKSSLARVKFSFQEVRSQETLPRCESESERQGDDCCGSDLNVSCTVHENGVRCVFDYDAGLFEEDQIERLAGHYSTLIGALANNSDRPVEELSILTEDERRYLIHALNDADEPLPDECLQAMIERQVRKTPNEIAIRSGSTELTYEALNCQANQVAHYLRQIGVTRGHKVGICLAASPQAMVAILAVVKAGAAYIPMDAGYPAERLQHMVSNAEMSVVLSLVDYADTTSGFSGVQVICLDDEQAPWLDQPQSNPDCVNSVDDLLYVVYTSGSTGLPKGAGVRHRNESNLLHWYVRQYEMDPSDRTLIISALGFDLTQKNLFALLTIGGCVVFPEDRVYDPVSIRAQIHKQKITLINCAPSVFYPLQERSEFWSQLRSLRCVLFGGEPIQLPALRSWLQHSGCQLVNMYGPTECTDIAATYTLRATDYEAASLPIGRPNSNVRLYVLRPESTQLVPFGMPGELCIGGAGVGVGYLNNEKQTDKVFIENPFVAEDGYEGKLYRTGDLVKYRQDGNLEFIGRIDNQVKIRGLRIELGEIESALRTCSAVREAVVVASGEGEDKRLVAYIVAEAGNSPTIGELRHHLARSLPEYMLPQQVVCLSAMPLTANGKIDRRRLPCPEPIDAVRDVAVQDDEVPRDSVESALCRIWQDLLQVSSIGIHSDFFDLGGHSMLAVRLMSRIEAELGQRHSPALLMRARTVADLAEAIREGRSEGAWSCLVPIRSEGSRPPLFLMHAAGGNLLVYDELATNLGPEQPVYGLQSKGLDGALDLHGSIEEMAAEYRAEIERIQPRGPYFLGGYCMGGTIALEVATQLIAAGEEVGLLALIDTHNWCNLDRGSLPARIRHGWERGYFHVRNWISLGSKDRKRFVRGKYLELKRRTSVWQGALLKGLGGRNVRSHHQRAIAAVWANNDRIADNYQPKTYPGRITQFVPFRNYTRLRKTDVGWEAIARDGVDVQSLPVYPAGLLMEPYVRYLADEISKRIETKQETDES